MAAGEEGQLNRRRMKRTVRLGTAIAKDDRSGAVEGLCERVTWSIDGFDCTEMELPTVASRERERERVAGGGGYSRRVDVLILLVF